STLGDAELRLRAPDELPVALRSVRDLARIQHIPAIIGESLQVFLLPRMNGQRRHEFLRGELGQADELTKRMCLLAVENAVMLNGSVTPPVADRCQAIMNNGPGHR